MAVGEPTPQTVERAGCGRPIDELWELLGTGPDEHARTCPYCLAALASLRTVAAATAALRQADIDDSTLRPQQSVKATIMQIARAEIRRGRRLPLRSGVEESDAHLTLTISEQAVADVVRSVADEFEGVRARRCEVRATGTDGSLAIVLRVSVGYGERIPVLTEVLRRAVQQGVLDRVGVEVASLDVAVEDVFHD